MFVHGHTCVPVCNSTKRHPSIGWPQAPLGRWDQAGKGEQRSRGPEGFVCESPEVCSEHTTHETTSLAWQPSTVGLRGGASCFKK